MEEPTSSMTLVWIMLWLVTIVASIRIGIIARRLEWRIGIVQGWIVPSVAFTSFFVVGTFYGYSINDEIFFYPERTYQWVVIWPTAIVLTVGCVLIWIKIQRQGK